jgi:hypothetical protein
MLLVARSARAQTGDVEPIGIRYEAPTECPDGSAFFREIATRTARVRAAGPAETTRVLHVEIGTGGSDSFTGRLTIEELEAGTTGAREVRATTCEEVVQTLGLVGALALDPKASLAVPTPPSPPTPPGPTTAGEAAPTSEAALEAPKVTAAETAHVPSRRPGHTRIGAGTQVEGAFIASLVPSARVFAEVEVEHGRDHALAPSLRLGATRSIDMSRSPTVGGATLQWTMATLEPCPVRFYLAREIAMRPCGGVAVGVLDAQGSAVEHAQSRARPWVAASAQVRLVWEVHPLLAVELESGAVVPFVRESFVFNPDVPIYTPPPVAFLSRAGVSVRFP